MSGQHSLAGLSPLGPAGLGVPPHPVPLGAYESMLLVVPIRDIIPLGQKSRISRLPRRGWVMVTVTATCSRVLMPESSRSAVLTGKGKAGLVGTGGWERAAGHGPGAVRSSWARGASSTRCWSCSAHGYALCHLPPWALTASKLLLMAEGSQACCQANPAASPRSSVTPLSLCPAPRPPTELDQPSRAGTGRACAQHLSLQLGTGPLAELQTLSRGPLRWGGASGCCQPPAPLQQGQRGAQGQAPRDSLGAQSCVQPESQGRLRAEFSCPLVAVGAVPCFCGQRPAKSGAGAFPNMVKGRGACLAAAQPGHARSCETGVHGMQLWGGDRQVPWGKAAGERAREKPRQTNA